MFQLLSSSFVCFYVFQSLRDYADTFIYWRCGHQRTKSRTISIKINDFFCSETFLRRKGNIFDNRRNILCKIVKGELL